MTKHEWQLLYRRARVNPETAEGLELDVLSAAGIIPVIRRQKLRMLLVRNAARFQRAEWLGLAKGLAVQFVASGFADNPADIEGSDRYERHAYRMYRRVGACASRLEMPKATKRR